MGMSHPVAELVEHRLCFSRPPGRAKDLSEGQSMESIPREFSDSPLHHLGDLLETTLLTADEEELELCCQSALTDPGRPR